MIVTIEYDENDFETNATLFNIITAAMHQNNINYIPIVKGYELNGKEKTIIDFAMEMLDTKTKEPIIVNLPNKYLDELDIKELKKFYKEANSNKDKVFIILQPIAKDVGLIFLSTFVWHPIILDKNNIVFVNKKSRIQQIYRKSLLLSFNDEDVITVKSSVLSEIKRYIIDKEISKEKKCEPLVIMINGEQI